MPNAYPLSLQPIMMVHMQLFRFQSYRIHKKIRVCDKNSILLSGNALECDCELAWLSTGVNSTWINDVTCSGPQELVGKLVISNSNFKTVINS